MVGFEGWSPLKLSKPSDWSPVRIVCYNLRDFHSSTLGVFQNVEGLLQISKALDREPVPISLIHESGSHSLVHTRQRIY